MFTYGYHYCSNNVKNSRMVKFNPDLITRKAAIKELQQTEKDLNKILQDYKKSGKLGKTDALTFKNAKQVKIKLADIKKTIQKIQAKRYDFSSKHK